ncbi:TIGR03086 family metal-binding protein [Saccharopolyspora sp. ID03-671]|uniref:TIGR03086 family metal-binding protein n=1 Tax=Saccharopolyspora sp. ID03-671 TaxID=3073066 RepID=UPI0032513DA4
MSGAQHLVQAVATLKQVVAGISPSQLSAPTPCAEFDVRGLINHLLRWGPSFEAAARGELVPAAAEVVDRTSGDWPKALLSQLTRIAHAWSAPDAWTGETHMGGPSRYPSDLVGGLITVEHTVHAWDLTRASDTEATWSTDTLTHVLAVVTRTAPRGREMGAYAPEVPVPEDSPVLDKIVAKTGRNPHWHP